MGRNLRGQQPVFVVLVALLSLITLPLLFQQRHGAAWRAIGETVHPAHDLIVRLQLSLAREAAGTRGYLLTRDPQYAAFHQQARADRKRAYAALLETAPLVGADFRAEVLRLGTLLGTADALLDDLYSGRVTPEEYLTSLRAQHDRFQGAMDATERLRAALGRAEGALAADIQRLERLDLLFTIALVALAMAALLAVARLNRDYRLAAEREHRALRESERARAEAEHHGSEVERLGANWRMLVRGFAHDLKNPLNAATGFLHLLQQGVMEPLSARQAAAVIRVRRSVDVSLQLIEDLLSVAKTEAGQIELARVAIDLRETARAVLDEYEAAAAAKGLALRAELPDRLPQVESDPARVEQILTNLVANAINYTRRGGVTLRVGLRADAPGGGQEWAVVEVADTGPGLSDEQQREVFNEFRRFETAGAPRGSGIGLAISSRLARALGGQISVRSEVGRGSAFELWLPVVHAGAAAGGGSVSHLSAAS